MTFKNQIENQNFLSHIGFKFSLARFPKVAYFAQSANIPAINLGQTEQPTPLRGLPLEGFLDYDPFSLSFIIDEDMENYMILHNWLKGVGTPNTVFERSEYRAKMESVFGNDDLYADGTLTILNSNFNMNYNVIFKDLFPVSLSALDFNATIDGTEYAMAQATFRYLQYEVRPGESNSVDKRLT